MHLRLLLFLLAGAPCATSLLADTAPPADPSEIATAINALGLDLYRQQASIAGANLLLSPYSLSAALAMACTGADGATREEMQRVLHLPGDQAAYSAGFLSLAVQLANTVAASVRQAADLRAIGGETTPIQLSVANQLFVQPGYPFRPAFLASLRKDFDSTLVELDFRNDPAGARMAINQWVTRQTEGKIRDLLPTGQPKPSTRLALVNAFYLRATWDHEFSTSATKPETFHFRDGTEATVPTMLAEEHLGYAHHDGYTVVALPYRGGDLQLVLLVPDALDGLAGLERSLTVDALQACTRLARHEVRLHLPRLKLEPATMQLGTALQNLGMKTAFDQPKGSANFDRMAPRKPDDYLCIGEIFHKTWLTLDEHGTEAAAATAVLMLSTFGVRAREPLPTEVRVDRPFLFVIQHVNSGVCLFLGRVTDPR